MENVACWRATRRSVAPFAQIWQTGRHMARHRLVGALTGLLLLVVVPAVGAPAATASFDAEGVARFIDFIPRGDRGWLTAVDARPDGTVVAAGVEKEQLVLLRLRPDGSRDPAFGTDGVVIEQLGDREAYPGRQLAVEDVASLPDGGVVVAGAAPYGTPRMRLFVRRYDAAGRVVGSFGTAGSFLLAHPDDHGSLGGAVSLDAEGRILVTGAVYRGQSSADPVDLVVARLSTSGTLDPSFGTSGRVDIPARSQGTGVQSAPSGDIVVTSTTVEPRPWPESEPQRMELTRLTAQGVERAHLRWRTPHLPTDDSPASDLALRGEQPIVASCYRAPGSHGLVAFLPSLTGTDPSFGTAGLFELDPSYGAWSPTPAQHGCPAGVGVLTDGRVAWGGSVGGAAPGGGRWAIGLTTAGGVPDPTFNGGAAVIGSRETSTSMIYPDVEAIDVSGERIVAVVNDMTGALVVSLDATGRRWTPPPPVPQRPPALPGASTPTRPGAKPPAVPARPRLATLAATGRLSADGRLRIQVTCTARPCHARGSATIRAAGRTLRLQSASRVVTRNGLTLLPTGRATKTRLARLRRTLSRSTVRATVRVVVRAPGRQSTVARRITLRR